MAKDHPVRWEVSPGEKARLELTFSVDEKVQGESEKLLVMARAATIIMTRFKGKVLRQSEEIRKKSMQDPVLRASLETTHALTILGGVGKGNTIPGESKAELKLLVLKEHQSPAGIGRLLPKGVVIEAFEQAGPDCLLRLKSQGEAGHASLPPMNGGSNLLLVKAIIGLEEAIKRKTLSAEGLEVMRLAAISDESRPETADFAIDFRLVPDDGREAILSQVKRLIKGLPVSFKITDDAVISQASSTKTKLFYAIQDANRKLYPDARKRPPVETPILNSTTDAAYFRQLGMTVYGFEPIMLDPVHEHSHGDDEQIPVASMRFATEVTEYYLKRFLEEPTASRPRRLQSR